MTYHPATAALLLDPYNPLPSEAGKVWPHLKIILEEVEPLDGTSGIGRPPAAHRPDFAAGEALKLALLEAWRNLP